MCHCISGVFGGQTTIRWCLYIYLKKDTLNLQILMKKNDFWLKKIDAHTSICYWYLRKYDSVSYFVIPNNLFTLTSFKWTIWIDYKWKLDSRNWNHQQRIIIIITFAFRYIKWIDQWSECIFLYFLLSCVQKIYFRPFM